MAGEIISEHPARSNRKAGRHHRGFAGDFPRNPQKRGLAAPAVHSALAITRRWRLQLSRVDQENSLKRRGGWPLALLSSSAAASSLAISPTSRSFLTKEKLDA